jgi:low affinity Fe/Cu permease
VRERFDRFAGWLARWGSALIFSSPAILAYLALFSSWLVAGPAYHFSEGWNFLGNQPMTSLSFFAAIFIGYNQLRNETVAESRDRAMHLKLDELVRAMDGARDELAGIEERPDEEIDRARR